MAAEQQPRSTNGLSRRQLLTRGAIAGGLVWAAPVIRSTAAYATTANGTERPCTNFFMVMIDPRGKAHDKPSNLDDKRIPPAIRQWFLDNPDVDVQFPTVLPLLTQTSDSAWAILMPEVTGPNAAALQCRMVLGWARKDKKFAEGYVDPNPPLAIEVGRRLIFPCPDPGGGNGGGGGGGGGGDDGGCKNGHDDGDHDADDVGCDPSAVASAEGASGVGTSDTVDASGSASSQIASDGSSSGSAISSDGTPSQPITSDGSPSTDTPSDPHRCIDTVFLIYCCPR